MDTRRTTRELYKDTFQMIHPSEESVMRMTYRTEEHEMEKKRLMPRRRMIAAGVVCCLMLSGVAFAASKIVSFESHAPSTPQCTEYSELSDITKDLAYDPIIPQEFSNGYEFKSATLGSDEGKDADGNTVMSGKLIDVSYANPKLDDVMLSITSVIDESDTIEYDKTRDVNGVTVGASTFIIKFVPPDYEKTDEDIAREKNGTIQISYGSDTIEESSYASVTFMTGGARYTLLAEGDKQPSQDELLDMAEEMLK